MMWLMDILSEDEWELLKAKLLAGRIASRMVAFQLDEFCEQMGNDWPYNERMAYDSRDWNGGEWSILVKFSDALIKINGAAYSHHNVADELHELASW